MKVIILAAGFATRLQPLTTSLAKPLLPVAGKVMIEYILDALAGNKYVKKISIVTNKKFFGDFQLWKQGYKASVDIEIINDGSTTDQNKLGAIGDLHYVIEKEGAKDDLLVVAGDNLFDLDINDFVKYGRKKGITISAYDIGSLKDASRFGVVTINSKNLVVNFQEKPYNPPSTLVAMCLYYFPKDKVSLIKKYIAQGNSPDAPGNYIAWLSKEEKVYCYVFKGLWFDIGSFESYDQANKHMLDKRKIISDCKGQQNH